MARVILISTSLDPESKGKMLAQWMQQHASDTLDFEWLDYGDHLLPDFDNDQIFNHPNTRLWREKILGAEGIILMFPVYNWSICANLKKLIETVGTHYPELGRTAVWFDRIITFVSIGGLHHSYMSYSSAAMSLMLDFKCIINPYMVYARSADIEHGEILDTAGGHELKARILRTLTVKKELLECLANRTYQSTWEV
ncbi:NADPH-dependent FMN reductase [Deinococcus roseus]|uniref:NAD(P)H-dependent oxidoreductase n=1 Tax=Deinococcus roseus TaxID=392414 RepID=A0ABQ2CVQ8_9DEIO|nr:NAD(P)H-dependent oxidoreductase [Deinococcus roseus]GGJ18682.1 NAD(P)H-dependent oxidoreductase [Deinococcus roseus]